MIGITILGATGSIGVSTLDVIARHPDRYRVVALTGHRQLERLAEQCAAHRPDFAVVVEDAAAEKLQALLNARGLTDVRVLSGVAGLEHVASLPEVNCVMAAIVGAAGLAPTLAAVRAGKRLLLANKEALVMSGQLFMDEVRAHGAQLLPIDSEHNAIFQCMPPSNSESLARRGIRRIVLTASGGPFRRMSWEQMTQVTPAQAVAHPNWDMGKKISVDSASMMNKGLEVIETRWLFDAPADVIDVVVHPQSVIHSMVEYVDGSVLAQLGNPDMRTPIAHALAWPDRITSGVASLDFLRVGKLEFEPADEKRFPCLALAYQALRVGGTITASLNAANEVAVDAFLNESITFTQIPAVIEATMADVGSAPANSIPVVLAADAHAREVARMHVQKCRRVG